MGLKFTALSGTTGVTENLYLYEYGNDIIIVDCGVGFPEADMYGVDLVIPDFTYIRENKSKIRALLVTHGHEDHLGAIPFLLKEIDVPIYSTKLVAGFIEDKLEDYKIENKKINVFDPERDNLSIGVFRVFPFRISHSVPDAVGYCIDTPEGKVFHVPDFKFDWTPVDKKPFDVGKAASLALGGCLALACDSLGSTTPGYTESEIGIEPKIEEIAKGVKKGAIFFTTISSNISRMQQAINVAARLGRKVVFIGRSIDRKAEIARNLGYLSYSPDIVIPLKRAQKMPREKLLYIISGSYGQPGSALYRLALGEHDYLSAQEGDVVIFSADPAPPGSKTNVDFLVDKLIEANIDVHYYDLQEDLHVSGHGSQEDIKMLFALTKPKYFIPIGGTVRHMRAYKDLAINFGAKDNQVFELQPGDVLEMTPESARLGQKIPVKNVLVDGLGIGDVGSVVLRDRQILAKEGVAIALIQLDTANSKVIEVPDIISRGFVFQSMEKEFLKKTGQDLLNEISKRRKVDNQSLRNLTIDFLERYFYKKIGRRPMVLPVIVEV